ncbi:MAG TPA: hypothetical protein VK306_16120 [Acidimicrobiales bacterium]|nr:hypothetical protein [Acidimicrobiales bacterium]
MTYQDRLTSAGPARDDPEFGDPLQPRDRSTGGKDQAQQVAGTAAENARNVASTATGEARDVARTAQSQARRLAGEARSELRTQASSQVNRLADGIDQLARQLRSMSQTTEPGPAADLAGEAAERSQQVAERLREGGLDDAIAQVRNFGRNRPGLFLLGAFGVGIAAGRLVRNVAQDPDEGSGQRQLPAGYAFETPSPAPLGTTAYEPAYGEPTESSAHTAYGAPTTPVPPAPGVAPVGDERWSS